MTNTIALKHKHKEICISDILYITKGRGKSFLHLLDGSTVECFETIRYIIEHDEAGLLRIFFRGIAVNMLYVESIDGNECTMSDGTIFTWPIRTLKSEMTAFRKEVNEIKSLSWQVYSQWDEMPLATFIIEVLVDVEGNIKDYIFRYCNKEMEKITGISNEDIINKSIFKIIKNKNHKWLTQCADVALNGTKGMIETYSDEVNAKVRLYCYRPRFNCCACALIKL